MNTVATKASRGGQQLIVVSCYTRFDNLAHGPRGTQAKRSLYTFRMDPFDGQMVLLSVSEDVVMNPAVCPHTGRLRKTGAACAGGTSTCYLTLDRECNNMLVVNYWDATIGVFGVNQQVGTIEETARSFYDPNNGRPMKARHDKHVNHSENDHSAQAERQADPHSHAVILDAIFGRIAYVPDLGMDLIRQFRYDPAQGKLIDAGYIRSGPAEKKALGPRYIEFHPTLPVCYVINELSSEVSVFDFDAAQAQRMLEMSEEDLATAAPTLRLRQTIRTIPDAFPGDMNTCGRITAHSHGNFVLVSNRGHDSITVFRVNRTLRRAGELSVVGCFHTRGATPRHFAFDHSGQWLISCNQDSDRLAVFRFNLANGKLEYSGHEYSVPSPNFACSIFTHEEAAASESEPAMVQTPAKVLPVPVAPSLGSIVPAAVA
eukprot:CAMPEP_0206522408 /NCGR_PEP_ID=MMETSP0324_2-20121206/66975_1 /ASSEMBLY_ACC=CAM_ASM_000836 /TAXON_ID=2866 /ORGANISM="Crypthecodinium cohnii, Strain Seligo" /LENGTH=429 /DNA_ID=CAMNT_0054016587 /DNA_START=38 /DNA_END=1324 /DNA_ORIENTATION=-